MALGAPREDLQNRCAGSSPLQCPARTRNSVALGTWPPLSSSSEAAGCASPRGWGRRTHRAGRPARLGAGQGRAPGRREYGRVPGLFCPPAQGPPRPRSRALSSLGSLRPGKEHAFAGGCSGGPRAQLAGKTGDTFGSSQPGIKARTPSAFVPQVVGNCPVLCAARRGQKSEVPPCPPRAVIKPSSQAADSPAARGLLQPPRPESGLRRLAAPRW